MWLTSHLLGIWEAKTRVFISISTGNAAGHGL